MSTTPAAQRRVIAAQRRRQALKMRQEGLSYREIGEQLGMSLTGARKAIHAALDALNLESAELVAELRALENARLDHFLRVIWPKIEEGNLGAIDRAIKISERRARLFGLDAPAKVAPTTPDGAGIYGEYRGGGLAGLLAAHRAEEERAKGMAMTDARLPGRRRQTDSHAV